MMFCRRCGRAVIGTSWVCPNCRTPTQNRAAAALAAPGRLCRGCGRDISKEPADGACPSCKRPARLS